MQVAAQVPKTGFGTKIVLVGRDCGARKSAPIRDATFHGGKQSIVVFTPCPVHIFFLPRTPQNILLQNRGPPVANNSKPPKMSTEKRRMSGHYLSALFSIQQLPKKIKRSIE
jgi:hypothetical protein